MGTIYRNGKVNTIIKNGKIYGYASGGGEIPIEIVEKTNTITTISTSGNDASISIDYYEDGVLKDSTGTILYSTVNNRTKAINFHLTKIWYDATHTNWRIEALCDCYYNDNIYTEGETIRDWSYAVSVDFNVNNISRRLISPILSGTTNPTSSQGNNGQIYLKYGNYTYSLFMNGNIIIRENEDDATDIKLFIVGLTRTDTNHIIITDTDLLAYLTDITTTGQYKGCDVYSSPSSPSFENYNALNIFYNNNNEMVINMTNASVTQRVSGTFYGMIDLNKTPQSSASKYQINGNQTCDTSIDNVITHSYLKVNNTWQNLIGSDIDDVGNTSETVTYINMSNITKVAVTSSMNYVSFDNIIVSAWDGNDQIAANGYITTPIDVTNINKLYYELETKTCWGGGTSALQDRWKVMIGLMDSPLTSSVEVPFSQAGFAVGKDFANSNTKYGTQEIDVSSLTGNYYFTFVTHGWNAMISNLRYE